MTRRPALLVLASLTVLNLVVFGQIVGHSFLAYDDGQFVYENARVKQGLTAESIRWALTSTELGFYPVTWLSHMLDVELYGLNPRGHFASALVFHILASWTVFFALSRLTGSVARSGVVAALFAVHPMHVDGRDGCDLAALAFLAWRQARLWKDTQTLFTHALAVTGPNPAAEYTLAQTLQLTDPDRALEHFGRVISISESMLTGPIRPPREPYVQSHVGTGTALLMKARAALANDPAAAATLIERAESAYRRAIQLDARTTANAQRNLALAAQMKAAAAPQRPRTSADPFIDDGVRRLNVGDVEGAIGAFQKAIDPRCACPPHPTTWIA